jgi:hypothetical protein
LQRAASRASNVRYDNGVTRTAPGYESVTILSSILTGLVAAWTLNELSDTRADSSAGAHALTLVPGIDSSLPKPPTVSAEKGLFDNAALFNALAYRSVIVDPEDSSRVTLSLTSGAYTVFSVPAPDPA